MERKIELVKVSKQNPSSESWDALFMINGKPCEVAIRFNPDGSLKFLVDPYSAPNPYKATVSCFGYPSD